jgi:Toprim domain
VIAPTGPSGELVITEGIEDALTIHQAIKKGIGVWAASSAGAMPHLAENIPDSVKRITIYEDANDAGRRGARQLAQKLCNRIKVFLENDGGADEYPDVNDVLRSEGEDAVRLRHANAREYDPERDVLPDETDDTKAKPPRQCVDDVHKCFRKWLGEGYDIDSIDAVLATAAAERLTGDPLWILLISGPGNAKTETVSALSGAGAHVTSTIASEGALLSATPQSDRSKNATGGLLRKIGDRGLLVIKDVTTILSSDRNVRGQVLAALREVYDGRWERNVGSDGGQTLTWTGRLAVVGAVTTVWDSAHAVVAACGDRFVLIRSDSTVGRVGAGNKAIRNTGDEVAMRAELAAVVGGVIAHIDEHATYQLNDDEIDRLLKAADIVTYARTAVERDYQGNVVDAHAPEMPTRFAKQLAQMVRGGLALGMTRDRAMQLALRCARDSVPPLRMDILQDLAANPASRAADVAKSITRPWMTVRRELEALHMLRLLRCDEERTGPIGSEEKTVWRYSLGDTYDKDTLKTMKRESASSAQEPQPEPEPEPEPEPQRSSKATKF